MSEKLIGILVGLVGDGENTGVGVAIVGGQTVLLPIPSAGVLFNQLGDLLEQVGFFKDDDEEGGCECKMKH